ncbi:MAG: cupin domain-containing protein [Bacteroidetes bacterium]|nr:MAG: cupin domain-containing protein [Bacteroidota bacterium]
MDKLNLNSIALKEIVPGFHARMVHTDNMTISFVEVEKGAVLPEHHHMHEQVTRMVEGSFELTLDGKTILLEPGDIVVIPSNVKHSGRAIEASTLVDVFNPVREDYRSI